MLKKIVISFFVCALSIKQCAAYYEYDKRLEQAYSLILSFQFTEAEKLLQQEKTEKPGNDLRLLYLNYIDFIKAFISDDTKDIENLKKNSAQRLNDLNRNKDNAASEFHLYVQSEILLQEAILGFRFNQTINSAGNVRKAYQLIKKNEVSHPTFILNKKISAMVNILIGLVPDRFNWIVKFAGLDGNISQGEKIFRELVDELNGTIYKAYRTEVLFFLGNLYANYPMNVEANVQLNQIESMSENSPLIVFVYSNILMAKGENEKAFDLLDGVLKDNSDYPFNYLYYKRGLTKLRKLDFTAEKDFKLFLKNTKGSKHVNSAHQKLAWTALLQSDTVKYKQELQSCKEKGDNMSEEDKTVLEDINSGEIENVFLLRSRLLFDGGYYKEALKEITGKQIENFSRFRDELEITYRFGRIMQKTGKEEMAIKYFEMTLKNGLNSRYYYAANSAYMLGMIYEENVDYVKAKYYYETCLSIKHNQYKNSIDRKARTGLDRIKEKK